MIRNPKTVLSSRKIQDLTIKIYRDSIDISLREEHKLTILETEVMSVLF
jgi:hypothetical protein